MSVRDSHTGRGSVRRMLRRNLTGPLLGKSRIQTGSGRFPVCVRDDSNWSCTVMETSTGGCEGNTGEEGGTTGSASEPQRPSEESRDVGSFVNKPVRGAESPTATPDGTEVDRSDRNRFARKLRAVTQVFSTSVSCLACAQRPDERDDGGEYHTVTVFNTETRDSLELTAQSAAVCRVSEPDFATKKEESVNKTFKLLTRLIVLPKLQSKAKSPGRVHCLRYGRSVPGSLTRQGHRPPKPSPFYQERIGETEEFVEEEVIVLANEHADGSAHPVRPEAPAPSVHVCAMTLETKDGDGSPETPPRVSDGARVTAEPREVQVMPRVVEDPSAWNGPSSQHVGEWQNMEHPRLRVMYDSNTIHHKASVEHVDPPGNRTPAAGMFDDDDDDDDGDDDDDVQSRRRPARSCNGENAELQEAASSVVLVAIKAALSQFERELLDTTSSLDQ